MSDPRQSARPAPLRRKRAVVIGGIVAALVVGGGIAVAVAVGGDDDTPRAAPTGSTRRSATSTAVTRSRTTTSSGTDTSRPTQTVGSITETAARATVVDYLNDVNDRDKAAGAKLICAADLDDWKKKSDGADSDFNFTVTKAVFHESAPNSARTGLVMHYTLTFDDSTSSNVDFTVVDEAGPKICGIATV